MIHRGQLHHKFWLLLPALRLRLLSHMATRWQCCSIIEFMLTYLVLQEKERRMERRRKTESRDRKKERDFFFALYVAPRVAWQLEGISHSLSLSQQLPKLMTLRITANGA